MRLLLVEDEPELSRRLSERLRGAGFAIDATASALDARAWPDLALFDAVILDLGLPDGDGIDVLQHWRNEGIATPVILLTARGGWEDKVTGLNLGADDFIVKPVRFEELLARLHAVMRRRTGRAVQKLVAGDLMLDVAARQAHLRAQPLILTRQEWRLLHGLMERRGQIVSQADLIERIYDLEATPDRNAIEALVSRLRRKIGAMRIITVRGMGYRLS
jgi:two-component system, OmpR family, response regulator